MNNKKVVSLQTLLREVYDKSLIKGLLKDISINKYEKLGYFETVRYKDLVEFDINYSVDFNSLKIIKSRNNRSNKPKLIEKTFEVDRIGIIAKHIVDGLTNHKHLNIDEILCGATSLHLFVGDNNNKYTMQVSGDLLDGMEAQLAFVTMLIIADEIYNKQGYKECREWLEECLSIDITDCERLNIDEYLMNKEITDSINKIVKIFDI